MAGLKAEWTATSDLGVEYRKYSITWKDDTYVLLTLHLIVLTAEGDFVQENITPITLPREAAQGLMELLGEALHNKEYWEEQSAVENREK